MNRAGLNPIQPRSSQSSRHAFTLLEIMIAISIAAIIMATGIPAFVRAMKKEGLRKAVSDVVEGCSHARAFAILKDVPMELVIRAEDGHLSVQSAKKVNAEGGAASSASEDDPPAAETTSTMSNFSGQIPQDVAVRLLYVNFQDKMEEPEARVRFFPNGTSDEFTIILFSESGEKKISLDVITGLADTEVIR